MSFDHCRFGKALRSASALLALALIAQTLFLISNTPARAESADQFAAFSLEIPELAGKGEMGEAIALAERYVTLARETSGEDSLEYATAATWLGWLYKKQQRYADAEALLKQALAIREQAFGANHALVATSLNNLVGLYQAEGRDDQVAALQARIDAVRAKAVGLSMLEALPREIEELQAKGQTAEAARLAEHYLALSRERHGANQPAVVPALLEAASLFEQQGKLLKAEPLLKQALEIRIAAFGPRSPEVADSAEALGRLYQKAGRLKEAERSFKRALSIRKAALGRRNDAANLVTKCQYEHREISANCTEAAEGTRPKAPPIDRGNGRAHQARGKSYGGKPPLFVKRRGS
jgi:tetratricopeptide (TPR) repeat protein